MKKKTEGWRPIARQEDTKNARCCMKTINQWSVTPSSLACDRYYSELICIFICLTWKYISLSLPRWAPQPFGAAQWAKSTNCSQVLNISQSSPFTVLVFEDHSVPSLICILHILTILSKFQMLNKAPLKVRPRTTAEHFAPKNIRNLKTPATHWCLISESLKWEFRKVVPF